MRYSASETAEKHERILDAAGVMLRGEGLSVNMRDIMKAAGLTHGAFYAHFDSKEDLIAESAERTLAETTGRIEAARGQTNPLQALLKGYLSPQHRDNPSVGCTVAALGSELARQPADQRKGFSDEIASVIDQISDLLPKGDLDEARKTAIRAYAMGIGALILSRSVNDADLSDEILSVSRTAYDK
jgi:TetR/AcrR family transcriptional regulator, transcriptional repressor for nem operon